MIGIEPEWTGRIVQGITLTSKLSANPLTYRTMSEHINLDVSAIPRGEMTWNKAGDRLIELIVRTANGRLRAAEALGHREFVLTKLDPRA